MFFLLKQFFFISKSLVILNFVIKLMSDSFSFLNRHTKESSNTQKKYFNYFLSRTFFFFEIIIRLVN